MNLTTIFSIITELHTAYSFAVLSTTIPTVLEILKIPTVLPISRPHTHVGNLCMFPPSPNAILHFRLAFADSFNQIIAVAYWPPMHDPSSPIGNADDRVFLIISEIHWRTAIRKMFGSELICRLWRCVWLVVGVCGWWSRSIDEKCWAFRRIGFRFVELLWAFFICVKPANDDLWSGVYV